MQRWRPQLVMVLTIALSIILWSPHASAKLKGKWKLIKSRQGIKVYTMKVKNSPLIAVRGDAILDAPLSKVIYLLNDVKHKTQWVDSLKKMTIVDDISATKKIIYAHFALPWPAAHRDFVYDNILRFDDKRKRILWHSKSVKHKNAPKTVGVRARMAYSLYILKPISNGTKTFMRAEIHGDPKGWLPAWFVNIIQKGWPFKTMKGIQRALKQKWVKKHPLVVKAMKRWQKDSSPKLQAAQKK